MSIYAHKVLNEGIIFNKADIENESLVKSVRKLERQLSGQDGQIPSTYAAKMFIEMEKTSLCLVFLEIFDPRTDKTSDKSKKRVESFKHFIKDHESKINKIIKNLEQYPHFIDIRNDLDDLVEEKIYIRLGNTLNGINSNDKNNFDRFCKDYYKRNYK